MRAHGLGIFVFVLTITAAAHAAALRTLTVFAAASLTEPFTALGKTMEERNPSVKVAFSFAGSQQLASQIEHGAKADVFASADQVWMTYMQEHHLVAGQPRVFVGNRLVVVIPAANPAHIERLQDLGRAGVKLVLAAEVVPAGRYSRDVLTKLSGDAAYGSTFSSDVLRNVVSHEENVKSVLAKIQLGEADAGIVYESDVTSATASAVRTVPIPAPFNVEARYPIAVVNGTENQALAQQFIALVCSAEGQAALKRFGLVPLESGACH